MVLENYSGFKKQSFTMIIDLPFLLSKNSSTLKHITY